MDEPKIFSVISGPVVGEMGPRSKLVHRDPCPQCGREYWPEVQFLHYELDYWQGEPLITLQYNYAVTAALRRAIEAAGIKGASFRPMEAGFGDVYEQMKEDEGEVVLPEFFQLVIGKTLTAGPGWWVRGPRCPGCGRVQWENRPWTIKAILGGSEAEGVPPRTVVRSGYHGEDLFFLDDPGPPIITERFRQLLEENGVTGLALRRAEFADL